MPRMNTTVGQILVNSALPMDLRDYSRVLDKRGLSSLLRELATKHPEKYTEVSKKLSDIGWHAAYTSGGQSFGLRHLQASPKAQEARRVLRASLEQLYDDDNMDDEERDARILRLVGKVSATQENEIFDEQLALGNPLAQQVQSGSRGNKMNLASLLGSDLLYTDHHGRVIPYPVLKSYGQGLTPAEYWAGAYGARKGVIDLKMCLAGGTRVLMADYSEKPIKDVRIGDYVFAAIADGTMEPSRVRRVFNNGVRSCYKYQFRKGSCRKQNTFRELVATEDHRVLAQIKAGQPGSTYAYRSIYTPTLLPLKSARLQKNPSKNEFVAFPSRGEWNQGGVIEPRALLAGLMLSDGCMSPGCHGSYSLSCGDPQLLCDVKEYLAGFNLQLVPPLQGYSYPLTEIAKSARKTAVCNGKNSFLPGHLNETKTWLQDKLGDKLAHEKQLPDEVWGWDDASVGAILAGLFSGDSTIEQKKNGCSIKIHLTSQKMMSQAQRLLELRLGIWTDALRFIPKETLGKDAVRDQWGFNINHPESVRCFAERVPLVGIKKQELDHALRYRSQDPASKEVGFKIHRRKYAGELVTYDLEIEHPQHQFVLANGLIVSNSTQSAGFLSKQLNQIVHRGLVTSDDRDDNDDDGKSRPVQGLPVDTDDMDNEGALLAQGVGGYRRNQTLTPKILDDLLQRGFKRLLVRSPAVGGPADGGVYSRDAGIREFGRLPVTGDNVSLAAVQALSEPLTQAQISSKHSGGVATSHAAKAIGGFDYINQLIQVPKVFKNGAAHAEYDGSVSSIEEAPAGGYFVTVGGQKHYVGSGFKLKVKLGDKVEAGDVISEGAPNPALIVKHKGIGEGRRYFVKAFRDAFDDAGIRAHRRNIELLARGLINHVRLTDEAGDHNPDDVVPYARLEHTYKPREDARQLAPSAALGQHLERPVLHYSIGTRIRPSVVRDMDEFGIKRIDVHNDPPPFEAEMIRGMANLQHDPDWLTRMYGSGLQKGLFNAVHKGGVSDPTGTSFVPGLSQSTDFGRIGKVVTPKRASLQDLQERIKENKKPKVTLAALQTRIQKTQEKRAAEALGMGFNRARC